MTRHGKNANTLPFYTHAEKERYGQTYGTKSQRLGRASKRDFDACSFCLQPAIDPVVCPKGHLGCKRCYYENVLQQKKEGERLQEVYNQQLAQWQARERAQEARAREQDVKRFEAAQTRLLPERSLQPATKSVRDDGKSVRDASTAVLYPHGKPLDTDATADEGAGPIKSDLKTLPAFWVPQLTPASDDATPPKPPSKKVVCHASDPPHTLKLKQLVPVRFSPIAAGASAEETLKRDRNDRWMCPGCIKTLANNPKLSLLPKCGHVLCQTCVKKFVEKDSACVKCSAGCTVQDVIALVTEGTAYAASGEVEAKRFTTPFVA